MGLVAKRQVALVRSHLGAEPPAVLVHALDDQRQLHDYFDRLGELKLEITGADLAELGLAESPRVGEILAEVRRRKLNGELAGRESQLEAARELVEQP